jgi:hypothetical protein
MTMHISKQIAGTCINAAASEQEKGTKRTIGKHTGERADAVEDHQT